MAQSEQDSFGQQIVEKKLLNLEQLSECIRVKEQFLYLLGLDLPLYHVIIEKYGGESDFVKKLLQVRLESFEDTQLEPTEILKPGTSPETEQTILEEIQRRVSLTQDQIYECLDIQMELSKMGLSMAIPDILVGKEYVDRKIVEGMVGSDVALPTKTAMMTKQKPHLSMGKIARRTKDGRLISMDIGELALHSKMIAEKQLQECLELQQKCKTDFNLDFPIGQILFEKFHFDRSLLRSLFVNYFEIQFRAEQEAEDRRRLTPEGEAKLTKVLQDSNTLSQDKLSQLTSLQSKLKGWGLTRSAADILAAQKVLSDKSLAQLKLPTIKVDESVPSKKILVRMEGERIPLFGELTVSNGIVQDAQLKECLNIQERCKELGLNFKIGEIMVDKGLVQAPIKRAILLGQAHLLAQQSMLFNIIKFGPRDHRILGQNLEKVKKVPENEIETSRKLQSLFEQYGIKKSVSELLVMRGIISTNEIKPILDAHKPKPLAQRGPETKGLRIPEDVISKGEREISFGRLAVYNEFLTQEEMEECTDIQERCRAEFDFEVDLGLILLKKGYITQKNLKLLLEETQKIQEYLDWSYHYSWLKFSYDEEQKILESMKRSNLVIPSIIEECYIAQKKAKEFGIALSLIEVMVYRGVINEDMIIDVLGERKKKPKAIASALRKAKELYPERTGYLFMSQFVEAKEGMTKPSPQPQPMVMSPPEKQVRYSTIPLEKLQQEEPPPLQCLEISAPTFSVNKEKVKTSPEIESLFFGKIGISLHLFDEKTLSNALLLQEKLREFRIIRKIGDILVDIKILTLPRVQKILEKQKEMIKRFAWPDIQPKESEDILIKDLIVQNHLLEKGELSRCLYIQKTLKELGYNKSLSNILYDSGMLDQGLMGKLLLDHKTESIETAKLGNTRKQNFEKASGSVLSDRKGKPPQRT